MRPPETFLRVLCLLETGMAKCNQTVVVVTFCAGHQVSPTIHPAAYDHLQSRYLQFIIHLSYLITVYLLYLRRK